MKYSRDQELEESFTFFSSLDLVNDEHSSINELFSDEDENDHEDEDAYFEITLEPAAQELPLSYQLAGGEGKSNTSSDEEKELIPISFSSTVVSLGGFSPTSPTNPTTTNSSNSSNSCDDGYANAVKVPGSPTPTAAGRSKLSPIRRIINNKQKKALALKLSSLLGTNKENGLPDDNRQMALGTAGSRELVRSRKTSKVTTTMNGGVMKFLIKIQSTSIRSMVTSFSKLSKALSPGLGDNNGTNCRNKRSSSRHRLKNYQKRVVNPFEYDRYHWTVQMNQLPMQGETNSSNNANSFGNGDHKKPFRVLEIISLETIKGMMESLSMNIGLRRSKVKQKGKTCPSNSSKSSPLLRRKGGGGGGIVVPSTSKINYTRDNSVQAAIAHCKTSFVPVPNT